jgi:hypothetical protein
VRTRRSFSPSFSPRSIARTIHAVIESGSGVTSVRPLRSVTDFIVDSGFTSRETV